MGENHGLDLGHARLKLQRSLEHLAELDREQGEWFAQLPIVPPEWSSDEGWWLLHAPALQEAPDRLALIAGDAIQNARVSLEYLATALILSFGGFPNHVTGFPVAKKESEWLKEFRRKLPAVPEKWAPLFEPFQPFAGEPRLAALVAMSNYDKHRLLLPRTSVMVHGKGKLAPHPTIRVEEHYSPALRGKQIHAGDTLLRVRMSPSTAHPDHVLSEMNAQLAVTYSRDEEGEPGISRTDMRSMIELVGQIIEVAASSRPS